MRLIASLILFVFLTACGGGGGGGSPATTPPRNAPPVASNLELLTRPATPVSGTLSAVDSDGDALSYAVTASPTNGGVVLSGTGNRDFEYTPGAGFSGVDTFTYTANDGAATSNAATVTVTVNTPPSVNAASYDTSDIGVVTGTVTGSDADGDTLVFATDTGPTKGTLANFDPATGNFTYMPTGGEDGADSFTFTASDAVETSAAAMISIEIFGWSGTSQFGSSSDDLSDTNGLAFLPDGSLLHAGYTEGQIGSDPVVGMRDIFVRRTDRRGNETSLAQFGSVDNDAPRGVFARPQGDGYYIVASQGPVNLYRFDNDGNEIYSVPLPVTGGVTVVATAYWNAVDQAGDVYILSWADTVDPNVVQSGLISKLRGSDGALIWQRELPTSLEDPANPFIDDTNRITPRGIDFDSNGDPVVAGAFWDTSNQRPCLRCGFLAKFSGSDGSDVWLREPDAFASCGGDGNGRFFRVTVADDDSLYVTGHAKLDTFVQADGYVARYSADGTQVLWSDCDDSGNDWSSLFTNPLIAANGDVIILSTLGDATSPPDGNGSPTVSDLILRRFDPAGTELWNTRIEASRSNGNDAELIAGSIVEDGQGILYLSATLDGELTAMPNAGGQDAVLMRVSADGAPQ